MKNLKNSLHLSHSDIADFFGLTIETLSRHFTILVKERIISLESSPFVTMLNER
jgi:CRP-like cAMP-binding protein